MTAARTCSRRSSTFGFGMPAPRSLKELPARARLLLLGEELQPVLSVAARGPGVTADPGTDGAGPPKPRVGRARQADWDCRIQHHATWEEVIDCNRCGASCLAAFTCWGFRFDPCAP